MRLKTKYEIGSIPLSEHPTPQSARDTWMNLNGKWSFYKESATGERSYEGEILVPFSPETLNSGIPSDFALHPKESLHYKRRVVLDDSCLLGCTVLHFGAVDSFCEVYWNGVWVGSHRGGFTSFSFDISSVVRKGENDLTVICTDEATRNGGARGKQSDKRGGIWYTPQSGIWQTVWIESMPKNHIQNLKIFPDADLCTVRISSDSFGEAQTACVFDGEREILSVRYHEEAVLRYDFEPWTPENPKLYRLVITNPSGDLVHSYFGVRSFGTCRDTTGKMRLTLNGKIYFFNGVLDQGYWSDGMLTYPSDAAVIDELQMLKDMGFNTVRKHIKVEPMRWYYHCDRIGLAVWQDFVNGGGDYKFTHVAAFPFLGFHHRDSDYRYFAREDEAARRAFAASVDETLDQLQNCTCIGVWVPFNEGWGQFDSAYFTEYVRQKDPTRIIDSVSGWHDQGVGKTELKSLHTYYTKLRVPKDPRPVVLSEFGGYSMKVDGHVFDESKEFGYKKFKTREELTAALRALYLEKLLPLISQGLCACIYTQVSDVEEEINGLVTYDRQVVKVDIGDMKAINQAVWEAAQTI